MNWLISIISLISAAASIFTPQINGAISSHPTIATIVAGIWAIFAHIMPSPTGAAVIPATGKKGIATAVK